jgi:hypothetical protein
MSTNTSIIAQKLHQHIARAFNNSDYRENLWHALPLHMRDAWTHATETFLAELGLPLDGALDIENWPATYWSEKVSLCGHGTKSGGATISLRASVCHRLPSWP